MKKINYVESPSYGVTRALFFRDKYVRIHGKWFILKNKTISTVYGGVNRMTLLVQTDEFKTERLYFYHHGGMWRLDNSISFYKKLK